MADDFPIVCEKCLGSNPYLRMTRIPLGASCRISSAPFTLFKWKVPGIGRQRETIVSRDVATAKNVCQCCLCDLEYGLPSHVVDSLVSAVHGAESLPASEANREFFWDEKRRAVAEGREDGGEAYGKLRAHVGKLERIAAMAPYVNPYKHGPGQVPPPRPARAEGDGERRRELPPRDPSVTTLRVSGITPSMGEADLTRHCAPYGPIASVEIDMERFSARVRFHDRASAAACMEGLRDNLTVQGTRLRIMWARAHGSGAGGVPPGVRVAASGAAQGGSSAACVPSGTGTAPAESSGAYPSASAQALDAAGARPET